MVWPFGYSRWGRTSDLPERSFGFGHFFKERLQSWSPVVGERPRNVGRLLSDDAEVVVRWVDTVSVKLVDNVSLSREDDVTHIPGTAPMVQPNCTFGSSMSPGRTFVIIKTPPTHKL